MTDPVKMHSAKSSSTLQIVVLISGNGSNLQAIIDDIHQQPVPARIVAVISNQADAYGLTRAANANIPVNVINPAEYPSREAFDLALQDIIDHYQADLVVLAGFMRILSDNFVDHYAGKMINVHPSLLPKYQGLNTHQRALDANEAEHGASIHFVTAKLDSGPIILQAKVPVLKNDSAETLAARVHKVEHKIYPQVIRWFAEQHLSLQHEQVLFDAKPMTAEQKQYRQ